MKKFFISFLSLSGLLTLSLTFQVRAQDFGPLDPKVCLKKSLSSPCLEENEIQDSHLKFARVHNFWKKQNVVGSNPKIYFQKVIGVKTQEGPQDYPKFLELFLTVENSPTESPTPEACRFLEEKGIHCRTGAVEGTWLLHTQGLGETYLQFTPPQLRDHASEQGKLVFEAKCKETDFLDKAIRCQGDYWNNSLLENGENVKTLLRAFNFNCHLVSEEETPVHGRVSCQDQKALIHLLDLNFGETVWKNSYGWRVSDSRTNHYLTGY